MIGFILYEGVFDLVLEVGNFVYVDRKEFEFILKCLFGFW